MVSESEIDNKIHNVEKEIKQKEHNLEKLEREEKKKQEQVKSEEKKIDALKEKERKLRFDLKKVTHMFREKSYMKYMFLFLILIPLILSVHFRMQPASLPIMDDIALNNVVAGLRQQINAQVLQESPNLPPQTVEKEVEKRLLEEINANHDEFSAAVSAVADSFRERLQDEDGQTYLLAIDPYTYYRQTKNLIENGHVGDVIVNGTSINNHMLAPLGRESIVSLHPYFTAFLYKIIHPLTGKSLMGVIFLVPVIIAALAVIPAFFIGRRFSGNFGGFVSALIVGIHSAFINRTAAGFADTDAYNVTLPLFISWFLIEAWSAEDLKVKIIFSSISGFFVGLFAFTWIGWGFIFDIILAALAAVIGYVFVLDHKSILKQKFKHTEFRNLIIVGLVFVAVSFVFVSIFNASPSEFVTGAFRRTLGFSSHFESVAETTIWPNVFTTVAEQNYASFPSIINTMGGKLLFFLSLFGLLILMFREKLQDKEIFMLIAGGAFLLLMTMVVMDSLLFIFLICAPFIAAFVYFLIKKQENSNLLVALFVLIWFIATLYASRLGIRFTLILVPAFALGLGFCFGRLHRILLDYMEEGLSVPVVLSSVIVTLIFLLALIAPVADGWKTALSEIPSMDDGWYEALTFIKENSTDDDYADARWNGAIINSWWDFGHWFKSIADRAVTFDGASQNTPMAHWIGKALLTDSEDEAIGILRMLDCGSRRAFDYVDAVMNNSPKSVDILYEIIVQDRQQAAETLRNYGFDDEQAALVLDNTHCNPPEDYFITSEDMVPKSGVWAHFGSWDFYKAEMYMRVKDLRKDLGVKILREDYALTEEEASDIYHEIQVEEANDWISPWPSYGQQVRCVSENGALNCGGLLIDTSSNTVIFPQQDEIKIHEVIYQSETGVKSIPVDSNGNLAVAVLPGEKSAYLMSAELAHSMFNILFFYGGKGLDHFDLVKHTTTLTGDNIYVWKVDWNGK